MTPAAGDLRDHVVVFGYHGLARRVVKQLLDAGQVVVVIDPEASSVAKYAFQRWGAIYLQGSGRSHETLEEANVAHARAIICVKDDDLRNIETAMLVRELSPDVRIVIQMANAAVGRALDQIANPGAVIDVAALASDSFVEAAIHRTTHALDLGGEQFIVDTVQNTRSGNLRDVWGDLAPIAVRPGAPAEMVSCPGRDQSVAAGDLVTFIGTAADYAQAGLHPEFTQGNAIGRSFVRRVREGFAAMSDAVDRPFRIAFAILAGLFGISLIILTNMYEEPDGTHMNLIDALYFTSETIATVGFGDFYFRDQAPALRLWAIVLILMGATLVAVATALLTNALVARRLEHSLGRQRLTAMRDHIVVIGLGRVGSKVATDLRAAGYEVAVVDSGDGSRFIPQMRAIGVPVLLGDATLSETQRAAGIEHAAGVAILSSDDLVNIETGLAVRDALHDRPIPIVLRNYSHSLARGVAKALDVGIARSPSELAAPWFVGAALGLDVLGTFYVGSTPFMAASLQVHANGGLDGLSMEDLRARTRVVAIERADGGGLEHPPRRDTQFRAGDRAYLIGQYEELLDVLQRA